MKHFIFLIAVCVTGVFSCKHPAKEVAETSPFPMASQSRVTSSEKPIVASGQDPRTNYSNALEYLSPNKFRMNKTQLLRLTSDDDAFLSMGKVVAQKINAIQIGYRVQAIAKNSIYDVLGIEANDIILSINAVVLTSSSVLMQTKKEILKAKHVRIELKRGDTKFHMDVSIADSSTTSTP